GGIRFEQIIYGRLLPPPVDIGTMNIPSAQAPAESEAPLTKAAIDANIAELLGQLAAANPLELIGQATFFHHQAPDETSAGGITHSEAQVEYLVSLATARPFPENATAANPDAIEACLKQL